MAKEFRIGCIIADADEYEPLIKHLSTLNCERKNLYTLKGHTAKIECADGTACLRSVLCGCGKINAGICTAYLISEGVDIIINFGLAGGISGVSRGELVLGDSFAEHDFDLTPFGYKAGEKPGQEYIYKSDRRINSLFLKDGMIEKHGTVVTGDCFVSSEDTRKYLKDEFLAVACDMEAAAVAYACSIAGVPFTAVKKISDDAGSDATVSYRSMNSQKESSLTDIVFKALKKLEIKDFL